MRLDFESKFTLFDAINSLEEIEKKVLILRVLGNETYKDIGISISKSTERARQIDYKSRKKIRTILKNDFPIDWRGILPKWQVKLIFD